MIKRIGCLLLVAMILSLLLCGCTERLSCVTDEMFALDTIITFKVYDNDEKLARDTITICRDEILRLEALFSATDQDSDIYRVNHSSAQGVAVDSESAALIKKACDISASCDGAFDITIRPLVELWGFDTKQYKVPSDEQIRNSLEYVDYKDVDLRDNTVTIKDGAKIDLGGIAKGYIADAVYKILESQHVFGAVVNLGGTVVLYGDSADDETFSVGVEHPNNGSDIFATLKLSDKAVVTSGAYQRFFEQDSVIYHHILNPDTGRPSDSDISSVTVIFEDACQCDALSTAFYVMGVDKTLEYIRNHSESSEELQAIILNSDFTQVYVTRGVMEMSFELERKYSDDISINVID